MKMMRLRSRKPTSPGEILSKEYLEPMNLTQKQLAEHLDCDIKVINRIVNEKAAVTVPIAMKLAAALKTSPEFWLNAQRALDLFHAEANMGALPKPLLKTG